MTPAARTRARRGEGERLRDEILDAAETVLAQAGSEQAMSMRAVADAAGVSPPSIYMHFADKTDLVYAVCERHFTQLHEHMEEAASAFADPLARLAARGRAYVQFGIEHAEQYRVLFMGVDASASYTPERMSELAGFQSLVDDVSAAMDAGVLAKRDPTLVAVGLWANVHGITSLVVSKPSYPWPPIEELVDHVLAVHAAGLSK
jgi:AcrR family transcriptional regulator